MPAPPSASRPAGRRWSRRTFVAVLLIAAACRLGAQAPASSRSFLWKASAKGAVVYLVGSVHLLTQDFYPLSPALDAAFNASELLVEEVDLGRVLAPDVQLKTLRRGMLPPGQTLDQVLSRPTLALVTKRAADLGIPFPPLQRFKPWSLALTLLGLEWQKAGFDAELGLDRHFYDRARARGMPVEGLETVDFQLSRLDDMPIDLQERMLQQTLNELDTQISAVQTLVAAWKTGDAATVERLVLADLKQEPLVYERLLADRNRRWLPRIEALIDQQRAAFIVVGAAHLVGPDGLLASLAAKGVTIEQL